MRKFRLPPAALTNLIDARTFDLYDDPMPGLRQLEGYCGETCSALFRLASLILSGGRDPGGADACGHAGVAYALTGLLRALPWQAARGQVYLPADVLLRHGVARETAISGQSTPGLVAALAELRALARDHLRSAMEGRREMQVQSRVALLPLALVEPCLKPMETGGYDPFRTLIEPSQWRVQWRLWRASRRV